MEPSFLKTGSLADITQQATRDLERLTDSKGIRHISSGELFSYCTSGTEFKFLLSLSINTPPDGKVITKETKFSFDEIEMTATIHADEKKARIDISDTTERQSHINMWGKHLDINPIEEYSIRGFADYIYNPHNWKVIMDKINNTKKPEFKRKKRPSF